MIKSLEGPSGLNGKLILSEAKSPTSKKNEYGLDFEIEKSGKNLSNGEKQIINFLRILLKDAPIICLDEATSNMDPKTDEELHRALFDYVEGRTLIVITHRLERISEYDKIIVMDKGEVVEYGSYEELKKNKNGFFASV